MPLGRFRQVAVALACTAAGPGFAADSATIFMYHHVADGTPAATSTAPGRFSEQLAHLERDGFSVLPLMQIIADLRAGRPLPERSVALTFDDGYRSLLEHAAPALEQRGWPYTVFVSPGFVDRGYGAYLTWEQLRGLAAAGATIGNHSLNHLHLVRRGGDESDAVHAERIRVEIAEAGRRLAEELPAAAVIDAFAYPYGEFDATVTAVVAELGLIGLGQHSGAIGPGSDWLALPRFAVSTGFDSIADFRLRAKAQPLLLETEALYATLNTAPDGRPAFVARLPDGLERAGELACYASGQGRLDLEWRTVDGRRTIRVQPGRALAPGRTKINCTVPHGSLADVYFWFSKLWLTRLPDGSWYSE